MGGLEEISIEIPVDVYERIDLASSIVGQEITQFILDAVLSEANRILDNMDFGLDCEAEL